MKRKQAAVLLQQLKAGGGEAHAERGFLFCIFIGCGKLLVTAIGS